MGAVLSRKDTGVMYEPLPTPLADHMTADLPLVADFRTLDGSTFHRLEVIIKRKDGHSGIYCLASDWPKTMASHLDDAMLINQSLREQVKTLVAQIDAAERETDTLQNQLINAQGNQQQRQEERRAEIERQNTERADFAAKQDTAWWQWYNTYLRSTAWRSIRQRVMDRANGMCEGCAANYATQVHHLTYAHVGNEFLWELVAVCDSCHTRYHAESESRNAA